MGVFMDKVEIEQLRADVRMLRAALSEQGIHLGGLVSQVARVTKRQDDLESEDLELKGMLVEFGKKMDMISRMVDTIFDTLSRRLGEENT